MSLKPLEKLEMTDILNEDHNILVYQDGKIKKTNSQDLFYTRDEIKNNISNPKQDIIEVLSDLYISDINDDTSLYDMINYVDKIDLFEIGTRRMVHDGTDTSVFSGTPSAYNNPKTVSMGVPQASPILDRCYRVGGVLTVIPAHTPDPVTDLIYAGISLINSMARNDFYGGDYASDNWKNGIYPWNQMSKVQDEYGNYFTRCPLYFIKKEYVTLSGVNISNSWPKIPTQYIKSVIYEYTFICKTKLPGYRPAEFFYKYIPREMVEDPDGEYIYIEDLNCYHKPLACGNRKRYSISNITISNYNKILTNYHDFSCYTISRENINGNNTAKSIPNTAPVHTSLGSYRIYCNNIDINSDIKNYHLIDLRSYFDFYCTLWEIEFCTIDSSSIVKGFYSYVYESAVNYIIDDVQNSNIIKTKYPIFINHWIHIGGTIPISPAISYRKVLSKTPNEDGSYDITIDGDPVTVAKNTKIWHSEDLSGITDSYTYRTSAGDSSVSSFRWNWIENPHSSIWNLIDGCIISVNKAEDGLYENTPYVCSNPYLYSNSISSNYSKLSYILPSEYLSGSGERSSIRSKNISQHGYDPTFNWVNLPCCVGQLSAYYGINLLDISDSRTSNTTTTISYGGTWYTGKNIRFLDIRNVIDNANYTVCSSMERDGE